MSGKKQSQQVPDYTGLSLQTSSMTAPVPYAGGLVRGTPNLIYYTDYTVKSSNKGGGGKGGGKTKAYTYSATIILALCEGPIINVTKTWIDQGYYNGFSDPGFGLFKGTIPQVPWSYLSTAHPADAFGYQGIAYVAASHYNLGSTPTVPQHSFEIEAPNYGTGYTGAGDADCALEIQRFLTNTEYGALFPSAFLDTTSFNGGSLLSGPAATTTGDSAYQTYCRAMGWGISPFINNQEPASDIVARWCQITNTAPVWTGYSLKFIPYGDGVVTGNGVTYNPPTTLQFNFTDDDYIQDGDTDPVQVGMTDWFDASNALALECRDRTQQYDTVPIDVIDQSQNELIGRRYASTLQAHEICYLPMAFQVASLLEQRMVYIRETYKFKIGPEYSQLEPMDCGTLNESTLGLVNHPVRIREIEEQDDGSYDVTCEEFPGTTGQPMGQSTQGGARAYNNNQVAPQPVNNPIIFEPNTLAAQRLNNGSSVPILCVLASGGVGGVVDPNWGGCIVNVSTDGGTTYGEIGTINAVGRQGLLTANFASYGGANPDTTHTLSVNLAESGGTLQSASTAADAANGVTLGIIQDGVCSTSFELLSPQNVTLTGANAYNLTTNYRGQYSTTAGAHTTGALYGRLDEALFVFPLPTGYIGTTLKIKLQSFNTFGNQIQDISTCTVYTYTPLGTGYGGGSAGVPTTPTGLTATPGVAQVAVSWNPNPSTDNVTAYEVWAANGTSVPIGSCSLVWTGRTTNFIDTGLSTGVARTYYVQALNYVGASAAAGPANATTSTTAVAGLQPFGYTLSRSDISQDTTKVFRISVDVSWTWQSTTSTPPGTATGKVQTGPPSTPTTFNIQKNGTTVGSATWAAGATTPTLTLATTVSFTPGDYIDVLVPSSVNGMSGPWSLTFMGTRP